MPTIIDSKIQIALALVFFGLGFFFYKRMRRVWLCGIFALGVLLGTLEFPNTPNHRLIEIVVLGLACLCDARNSEERILYFSFVRAFALLVLFYAGLQKVLLGTYFSGQYLAYKLAVRFIFRTLVFYGATGRTY